MVTGPIEVRGAEPGELLAIDVLETIPRVPYGVISNRHGRGALPGEFLRGETNVSVFAAARRTSLSQPVDRTSHGLQSCSHPIQFQVRQRIALRRRR